MTNSMQAGHLPSLSHLASNRPKSLSNSSESLHNALGAILSQPSPVPMGKVMAADLKLFATRIVIWFVFNWSKLHSYRWPSFHRLAH